MTSKTKKGNIQISFSWIFMIMVGTFFIYTAYHIIGTYMQNEELKFNLELQSMLSNTLTTNSQTIGYEENYLQPINEFFQNTEMEIICNNNLSILSINGNLDESADFLENIPTFMTQINEGDVSFTYIAVENFRAPYKISNLLAIVSKKNLIVFDSNSEITKILRDKFAESSYRDSLSFTEVDITSANAGDFQTQIDEANYNTIMFVSDLSKNLNFNLNELRNIKSYHLKISGELNDFKYGDLNYLTNTGETYKYPYFDFRDNVFDTKPVSLITMGLFSNPETFGCAHTLLTENTKSIFDFYEKKTNLLIQTSKIKPICSSDLTTGSGSTFDGTFQTLKYESLHDLIKQTQIEIKNNNFNNPNIIYTNIEKIHQLSRDLSENSCEMIY